MLNSRPTAIKHLVKALRVHQLPVDGHLEGSSASLAAGHLQIGGRGQQELAQQAALPAEVADAT